MKDKIISVIIEPEIVDYVTIRMSNTVWRLPTKLNWRRKIFFWILGKLFNFEISFEYNEPMW